MGPAERLAGAVERGDVPSASWLVGDPERVIASGAAGSAAAVPETVPASTETIYDLASLTKPLVTSTLALILAREAGFALSDPARRLLPELDRMDKREITLAHLLTHTSGLPDWAPLYLRGESMGEYLRQIRDVDLAHRPGSRVLYSDLGYVLLGEALARAGSGALDVLAASFIVERAGARACFRPGRALLPRIAATEEGSLFERAKSKAPAGSYARWREGVIRGEVHDQNAWAAGGVAGHAGLFGTAMDVYLIAREALAPEPRLLKAGEQRLLREAQTGGLAEPRSMGYRINRGPDGSADPATAAGAALPAAAFGHNGFTGTSVWMDAGRGRVYVLLTNRIHPRVREEVDVNALRREFHRLAAAV